MRFKPQIKKLDRVGDPIEGLSGLNLEVLTGDKTLIVGINKKYQFLDSNNGYRNITLDKDSAVAGSQWTIRNTEDWDSTKYLTIKNGITIIDRIYSGTIKKYIFDGTDWRLRAEGSGESGFWASNITFGAYARSIEGALTIGKSANAVKNAIALGNSAASDQYGISIGSQAISANSALAIGVQARAEKDFSIAIGRGSEIYRAGEITNAIGSSAYYDITTCGFLISTADNTPIEMRAGGQVSQRYNIKENSCVTFTILVSARDNTSGDCAAYKFEGLIKRDGANNTTMSVVNKTVIHEDDASWDCNVTADDTNESLKIEVTGDASNTVRWVARLDGVETNY